MPQQPEPQLKKLLQNTSAEKLISDISHHLSAGLCITNREGIILWLNRHLADTLHYQPGELRGKVFTELLTEEIRPYALMQHMEYLDEVSEDYAGMWPWLNREQKPVLLRTLTSRFSLHTGEPFKLEILYPQEEKGQALTQAQDKLEEQEEEINRINHRYKNLLLEMEGLMELHLRSLEQGSREYNVMVRANNRIKAVSVAYQQAYRAEGKLSLRAYLSALSRHWRYPRLERPPHMELQDVPLRTGTAYTLGIVLSEILYCGSDNMMVISTMSGADGLLLKIRPKQKETAIVLDTFAKKLVHALLRQLKAEFDFTDTLTASTGIIRLSG